jgi:hypothetical protein
MNHEPISKPRFFQVAAEFNIGRALASDIWFVRPIEHANDTEDEIRGNLSLMAPEWIEKHNQQAENLPRHHYQRGNLGRCQVCGEPKRTVVHNMEDARPELAP